MRKFLAIIALWLAMVSVSARAIDLPEVPCAERASTAAMADAAKVNAERIAPEVRESGELMIHLKLYSVMIQSDAAVTPDKHRTTFEAVFRDIFGTAERFRSVVEMEQRTFTSPITHKTYSVCEVLNVWTLAPR